MEIIWSKNANSSFVNILNFLKHQWSKKEIKQFIQDVNFTINNISNHPYIMKKYEENQTVRYGPINNHILIFYKYEGKRILILLFHDSRMDISIVEKYI